VSKAEGGFVQQQTIAETISCTGIGLHTGAPVHLTLHPAQPDSGLVFLRRDLPHPIEIPVRPDALSGNSYATSLGRGDVTISTVEHLLSALYCLGVHNARVEVDGPEIPIMDGSAASFVFLIRAAGIVKQGVPYRRLRVRRSFEIRDGDRSIRVEPSRSLKVTYGVDYAHPAIGQQSIKSMTVTTASFEREICRARTFGFLHEVEALWRAGLGRGGCLDNTVVLDESRVLNREGLRWPDEFVRHKVLDLLGDLALLGMGLEAHVEVERGGHALHQRLVTELLADPNRVREVGAEMPVADRDPVRVPHPIEAPL
jgi:UDP-3-O-[3-hydroxymyristoyl] N-acetylglucosamine deacetylase